MPKFKIGDQIETIERGRGFERATVLSIFTETQGRYKDKQMYKLKIMCGTATVPISAEVNYKLYKKK